MKSAGDKTKSQATVGAAKALNANHAYDCVDVRLPAPGAKVMTPLGSISVQMLKKCDLNDGMTV